MLLIDIDMFRELTGSITEAMNVFLTYAAATWGEAAFQAVPVDVIQGVTQAAEGISRKQFFDLCMEPIGRSKSS